MKDWNAILKDEFEKPYMKKLDTFLNTQEFYPPRGVIFRAFRESSFQDVKVVIMGQDPYHGPGQAHGLAFSVPVGIAIPPSLRNIFKEIRDDLGLAPSASGDLGRWAKQGVLLLNATLTVRAGEPKSHYGLGWEQFTDQMIEHLKQREEPLVFLLWGRSAIEKLKNQIPPHHLVLTAPHPSPLSAYAGFFGCRHFSKANTFLESHGKVGIDWS
jgi:uracil-DNA glycosylase